VTNNVDLTYENKAMCKILAESITCDKLINPEDLDDKMASNPFFITPKGSIKNATVEIAKGIPDP
jgi:hypothetical protein